MELKKERDYIFSIDFKKIIDKMVNHQGWLKQDASTICDMYRRYLFIQRKYRHQFQLPPSEEIDEFWHMHILDTSQYRRDCEAIFGEYLDHYPYFGIDEKTSFQDLEQAFQTMQTLYAKEFNGETVYQVRGLFSKAIGLLKIWFKKKPKAIQFKAAVP